MQTLNLNRQLLTGHKVGVVFGEFVPFHKGHLSLVQRALMENDIAVVVVSGSHKATDRGEKIGLPLERRFRYLREVFNDEPTLRVVTLNEDDMPEYPNGWDLWTKAFRQSVTDVLQPTNQSTGSVKSESEHQFTIYTGEMEYLPQLTKRLPKYWFVKHVDRNTIPVSGTEIRNNPMKYWDYIVPEFRRHFVKKVLIVGSASTGKSTLIRRLAKHYEAPFSEEHARLYEEQFNVDDNELTEKDYIRFINGQFDLNSQAIDDPSSKGIAILDTDAIVTRCYAKMYLPDSAMDTLEPLFQYTIPREELDLILVIPPITEYVDDGFRAMDWADSRYDFHNELMKQLDEFGLTDKIVLLDQTDKDGGFYSRFKKATQEINTLLQD